MKKKIIIAILCIVAASTPVYAAKENTNTQNALSSKENQEMQTENDTKDNRNADFQVQSAAANLEIAIYSGDKITIKNTDVFRIACLNEDSNEMVYIELNAGDGVICGYLEPGYYDVKGVYYLGNNKTIIGEPVALAPVIRTYSDEGAQTAFSIGEESVEAMKQRYGEQNLSIQYNLTSSSGIEEVENALIIQTESGEEQTPFVDESIFGGDKDALEAYRKNLIDLGYMNEDGSLTEKGQLAMEQRNTELNGDQEGISSDAETDSSDFEDDSSFDSGEETDLVDTGIPSDEIETIRFDEEETQEKENTSATSKALQILISLLPFVAVVGGFIFYLKKR